MPLPFCVASLAKAPYRQTQTVTHVARYRPGQETTEVGKLQGRKLKTAVTDRNSIRGTWRGTGTTSWPMSAHSIDGQASLDVPHRALLERTSLGRILKNGRTLWARATRRMTNDTTRPHEEKSL